MRTHFTILLALLALASHASAVRILGLFPHTGKSHQMVFEPLLYKLAQKGNALTVVSHFPIKNPPINYTDVSLEGMSNIGIETFDLNYFENPDAVYKALKFVGRQRIFKAITEFAPLAGMALDVCNKIIDWPAVDEALQKEYDLVLVETFNSDCMLGMLHVYGIDAPVVALSSSNLMPWSAERVGASDNPAFVPGVGTSFTSHMSFIERIENTMMQTYFKLWFRYGIQFKEQELIERHFGKKIPDLQQMAKNMSLLLVNTFHSLNGVRPLVPGLVEVGGMHLSQTKKPIPKYMERFVDQAEDGVILLSFGSLIKTASMPAYKEQVIMESLQKLKQRVIWKYEESEEEGTLVGNVLKVRWIPQYELLQHKKVIAFIGHGGLLGMTEAIACGKPMVVVPFFGDQPHNGAVAEEAGMAKVVSWEDLSVESLSEALEQVLSAETRMNAKRASQIWKDRPAEPLDTAVYWIERVARWGNAAPLHSSARELNLYEQALLDVTVAYLLVILALALIIRSFVNGLVGVILSSHSNEKKKMH